MLDVVAHDVRPALAYASGDRGRIGGGGTQAVGERGQHELRVPERRERNEDGAAFRLVGQQAGEFECETRLARPSPPHDRQDARVALVHERDGVEELLLAAEKPRGGARQLDAPGCAEWREGALAELREANRAFEVLQPVLAEVMQGLCVEERGRRGRDQDLAAVGECGDACPSVDIQPDVSVACQRGNARVQGHAHANRPVGERLGGRQRCRGRSIGSRQRDEEGISLRVHLDAAVSGDSFAHDPSMLGERVRVLNRAELVQQPRRALNVGEEEGDRAGREIVSHSHDHPAGTDLSSKSLWEYGAELDFSDGATSVIVLGAEVNAANAAWQAWADAGGDGPYPEVKVRNYAVELGLVTDS